MLVVIGCQDHFLSNSLSRIADENGLRKVRTVKLDRVIRELKQPDRLLVVDMAWDEIQKTGLLRQFINIGRISGNKVVCICPNEDEALKKMARAARPDEVFLRYDLETSFREFMRLAAAEYLESSKTR